jgi:hypothetical protein
MMPENWDTEVSERPLVANSFAKYVPVTAGLVAIEVNKHVCVTTHT